MFFLLDLIVRGRGKCGALVFEDDIIAAEGPAVVADVEMISKREHAPCQRVINTGERHL